MKVLERERDAGTQHLSAAKEQLTVLQQSYEDALGREKKLTLQLRDQHSSTTAHRGTDRGSYRGAHRGAHRDTHGGADRCAHRASCTFPS